MCFRWEGKRAMQRQEGKEGKGMEKQLACFVLVTTPREEYYVMYCSRLLMKTWKKLFPWKSYFKRNLFRTENWCYYMFWDFNLPSNFPFTLGAFSLGPVKMNGKCSCTACLDIEQTLPSNTSLLEETQGIQLRNLKEIQHFILKITLKLK